MKLIEIIEEDTFPERVIRHRPECRDHTGYIQTHPIGYLHKSDVLCKGKDVPEQERKLEFEATGTRIADEDDCYYVPAEYGLPSMLFEVEECEGCRPEPFIDPDVNEDYIPF